MKLLSKKVDFWEGAEGGLDIGCPLVFARVHFVLETPLFCSLRALFYR
jgi:hypothetical protein